MKNLIYITILLMVTVVSCQTNVPLFSGKNAFSHLVKNCEFGPTLKEDLLLRSMRL